MQGVSRGRRLPWTAERPTVGVVGGGAGAGIASPGSEVEPPRPRRRGRVEATSAERPVGLLDTASERVPWRRLAKPVALFALAFASAATAIHAGTPRNPGREIGLRLARLRQVQGEIDTLFIGSSRVQRGIDPQRFDELTAKAYAPTRSFNLGVPGMDALDADLVLRELAADPPPNLRYVILDPERLQILQARGGGLDRRSIAAHESEAIGRILACARASDAPLGVQLGALWRHANAAAHQYLNVSRCIPPVRDWIGSAPRNELLEGELGRNLDGFYCAEDFLSPEQALARRFPEDEQEQYGLELVELLESETPAEPLPRPEAEFYARLAERVRALGAVPIFLYSPGPDARPHLRQLARDGWIANFFDYGDPRRHPELYLKRNRFDRTHLNRRGATLFTEQLAADFSTWLWNGIQ